MPAQVLTAAIAMLANPSAQASGLRDELLARHCVKVGIQVRRHIGNRPHEPCQMSDGREFGVRQVIAAFWASSARMGGSRKRRSLAALQISRPGNPECRLLRVPVRDIDGSAAVQDSLSGG
jgi:hypothetical protein